MKIIMISLLSYTLIVGCNDKEEAKKEKSVQKSKTKEFMNSDSKYQFKTEQSTDFFYIDSSKSKDTLL